MNRYVNLPSEIKNIFEVESFFLEFFFNIMNVEQKENKFDMKFLENYYNLCVSQNQIDFFKKTVNELLIRGAVLNFSDTVEINMQDIIPNRTMYTLQCSSNEVIIPTNRAFSNFLENYHIKGKKFFNEVILNNLSLFLNEIDFNSLKDEFIRNDIKLIEKNTQNISKEIYTVTNSEINEIEKYFYEPSFESFREFCKNKKIVKLNQLTSNFIEEYRNYPGVGEKKYLNLLEKINQVKNRKKFNSLDELLNNVNLSKEDYELLEKRYLNKMTFSDMGLLLKTTKQRVNQKLDKIEEILEGFFKCHDLDNYLKKISSSKYWITINELDKNVSLENNVFLEFFKSGNILNYNDDLEIFIFDDKINEKVNSIVETAYSIKQTLTLEEFYSLICDKNIDLEIFEELLNDIPLPQFLRYVGYKQYGEYFTNKRLTNIEVCELIFKNYIKKGIILDEEGIQKILEISKEKFNLDIDISERNLLNILYSIDDIFLCGPKEYIHRNKINYSEELIENIADYLKRYFQLYNEFINIDYLFNRFKLECECENITTKQLLYSILKYHYDNEFIFGKGNTLNIYASNLKFSREEQVSSYLLQHNQIDTKENILNNLKWKYYQLDDTVAKSKEFICIDNKIALKSYITLTVDEEKILLASVENSLKGSLYYPMEILFRNLSKDNDVNFILNKYNLKNTKVFSYFIRAYNYLKDYKFINKMMFVVPIDSKFENVEDIIKYHFKDSTLLKRSELKDFYKTLGYGEAMIGSIDSKLIDKQIFLEVSQELVVPKECLVAGKNSLDILKKFIENKIGVSKFLVLNDLSDLRIETNLSYINPYVVKSLVLKYKFDYRFLKRVNSDYRYDKIILIKSQEKFENLEDLVYYLLKEEYSGSMVEKDAYDYLVTLGILSPKQYDYDKKLFSSFKDGSYPNLYIDTLGKIKLK